jgi:hypothetical protein
MDYLQIAEDFTTGENQAITYAIVAAAIELRRMREQTAFVLPSGKESINLDKVLSVRVSPYANAYEVLVYVDANGPAWIYHGEDAEALAKAFGLKWPETGGE